MKTRIFLLLALLISGLMILSACAPEATPEEPQETPYPYPLPEEKEQEAVQPSEPKEPYPEPQEVIVDEAVTNNPYPGIEVVSEPSNVDLSEALTAVDYTVQSKDKSFQSGPVYIDRSEIIMRGSDPVQVELILIGNLPTPCNQLRVESAEPDGNRHIEVEAYTVSDPDRVCAQVLVPFVAVVPLGEFTDGAYSVTINHEMNGEFQLP